jgi:hypothetical protein
VQRIAAESFGQSVRSTVAALRQKRIDVVLVGLNYTPKDARDEHYYAIRSQLRQVAAEENVLYVRRSQAMEYIAHARANFHDTSDDVGLSGDLGHECMAEHIAHAVIANVFVRRRKPPNLSTAGELKQ